MNRKKSKEQMIELTDDIPYNAKKTRQEMEDIMRKSNKIFNTLLLAAGLILTGLVCTTASAKTTVLSTDVSTPSKGCVMVGIEGSYMTDAAKALKRINEIRLEACKEGVPNPSEPLKALKESDYVPLKWSSDLEYIARIRAAEAIVVTEHTRPNGQSCFRLKSPKGVSSFNEVLAWSSSTSMVTGVNQWYREKDDWVHGNDAVTGHYTAMIDPNARYVGLGLFTSSKGAWPSATCGRFSSASQLDTGKAVAVPNCVQMLEVQGSYLSTTGSIAGTTNAKLQNLSVGDRQECSLMRTLTYNGNKSTVRFLGNVTWTSSNSKVATVDASGVIKVLGKGTAVIKAVSSDGVTATRTVTIASSLKKVKIKKVKAAKKKFTIQWKADKKVKGYQIQYSTKKNFKSAVKTVTVKGASQKSKTIKRLKSKKKYYVRMRSYVKEGGKKVYSEWSVVKKVKTK